MATPTNNAVAAQQATQVALAVIGAKAYMEVVALWGDVALASGQATRSALSRFVNAAVKVIAVRRRQAQQVTIAYERLYRTLKVGQPIRLPDALDLGRPHSTLDELYADLYETIDDLAPGALKPKLSKRELEEGDLLPLHREDKPKGLPKVDRIPFRPPPASSEGGVELEPDTLAGLERELDRLEAQWEDLTRKSLATTAADASVRARAKPEGADEIHEVAGRKLGAQASATVRGAGHNLSQATSNRDKKVIGWARVHMSFDANGPCAFCALMLSRGVVYRSKESAGGAIGGRFQYHPNCKCQAQAVYEGEDYATDPRFELNRFYRKKWDDNFKGMPATYARRLWRNYIDAFNKGQVS